MPNYHYRCSDNECQWEFFQYQSIKADALTLCPACQQNTALRVISGGMATIDKTPKSVGGLADQNRSRMTLGQVQEKTKEFMTRGRSTRQFTGALPEGVDPTVREVNYNYAPPWRPNTTGPDLSLNELTTPEKKKYIETGKKPK